MMTSEDLERVKEDRGDQDLTKRIEVLQKENQELAKDRIDLIKKCRHAGRMMIELNVKYEANLKEIDRLSEENDNLKTLLKGKDDQGTPNNS